jgi:hypothetical protein
MIRAVAAIMGAAALIAASDPRTLQRDVQTYDSFGDKLTGGPGNVATLGWIRGRLSALGYQTSLPTFPLRTFSVQRADLQADGQVLEGFPVTSSPGTAPSGVTGPLLRWDGKRLSDSARGSVALVLLPDQRQSSVAMSFKDVDLAEAQRVGVSAIVAVTRGPTGRLVALNADAGDTGRVPILLVAGDQTDALAAAAERRVTATVTIRMAPGGAPARNLLAVRRAGPQWIVISTPVSGWFSAAAERGPGVAIMLQLARDLPRIARCKSVAIIATSGHETGYGGMASLLAQRRLPPPERTTLWIHLGAGLAAWGDERRSKPDVLRYLQVTQPVSKDAATSFADIPGYAQPIIVTEKTAVGEAATVLTSGYTRVVAGVSAHLYHHTRQDHAERTDGRLIALVADAFETMVKSAAAEGCR